MIKIHVGCGKRDFGPEWYHVDGADFPHVKDKDVLLISHNSDSAEIIYACHFLEYFDRVEGLEILKEWYRVLKPGGILRIAVPDFKSLWRAYNIQNFPLDNLLGPLYGRMKMNDRWIYHKTVYDHISLDKLLMEAGFINRHRYDWRQTEHAHIDDHSQAYLPHMDKENGILISLNLEATK